MSPVDPRAYDWVVVAFSGGKDSLAALLHLLDLGVAPKAIELSHHLVDGRGPVLMDWPITPAYVAALADHFGLALLNSWREGGFRQEMDRDGVPTAPILFEQPGAPLGRAGGAGPLGVRALYPAIFAEIAAREAVSGRTIQRAASVVALADRGVPYPAALAQPELAALAAGEVWTLPVMARPWALPAGAFGDAAGPS